MGSKWLLLKPPVEGILSWLYKRGHCPRVTNPTPNVLLYATKCLVFFLLCSLLHWMVSLSILLSKKEMWEMSLTFDPLLTLHASNHRDVSPPAASVPALLCLHHLAPPSAHHQLSPHWLRSLAKPSSSNSIVSSNLVSKSQSQQVMTAWTPFMSLLSLKPCTVPSGLWTKSECLSKSRRDLSWSAYLHKLISSNAPAPSLIQENKKFKEESYSHLSWIRIGIKFSALLFSINFFSVQRAHLKW